MANRRVIQDKDNFMEMRWSPVVVLSILFHVAVFSMILFVPESISTTRSIDGIIYEVNLVEMPAGGDKRHKGTTAVKGQEAKAVAIKDTKAKKARRIKAPEKKEKPVVIAKRTVKKKTSPVKKPKVSSSQLIDRAISRIKKKVKSEDYVHDIDRVISRLESEVKGRYGTGSKGGQIASGIPIRIYQMEAENWIKSNWSYPVAIQSQKNLEAVVVVMVKRDGAILKTKFKKRSSSAIFDESVSKAIERSDPLPPFPEGYRKSYEEFVINFNLKEVENQ